MVELLLSKGADRNRRDRTGTTALESAVRARHPEVVEALMAGEGAEAAGALLNEAALKGQAEIADILIAKGASVDVPDRSGATPLHQAALKGNLKIATLLLDHGAGVDARDHDGATPLHAAALAGQLEMAKLLLDRGADREARATESGATPLFQAAAWRRTGVLELLIERGADVNARNKSGLTPLRAAEGNGFADIAKILRAHGAQ
jgi:ankyrin repeat protein